MPTITRIAERDAVDYSAEFDTWLSVNSEMDWTSAQTTTVADQSFKRVCQNSPWLEGQLKSK
jgi:hypothetical protein